MALQRINFCKVLTIKGLLHIENNTYLCYNDSRRFQVKVYIGLPKVLPQGTRNKDF